MPPFDPSRASWLRTLEPHKPQQPLAPLEPHKPRQPLAPLKPRQPFKPMAPRAPLTPLAPMRPMAPFRPMEPLRPLDPLPRRVVIQGQVVSRDQLDRLAQLAGPRTLVHMEQLIERIRSS